MPNRVRRWYSGHLFVCPCDSAVRGLSIEKSSQRTTTAQRLARAECTSLGPGLTASKAALTDSSLAAKRRTEALHVVFFSTKHPSPARELLLCVYSRMIRIATKDAGYAALLVL